MPPGEIVVFADSLRPCARFKAVLVVYSNAEYNIDLHKSQHEIRKIKIRLSYCAARIIPAKAESIWLCCASFLRKQESIW